MARPSVAHAGTVIGRRTETLSAAFERRLAGAAPAGGHHPWRAAQPRKATGASVNAVMRCRSLTRPAISSAVRRVTRSVPNSSTL
jgi:hypothetical protein